MFAACRTQEHEGVQDPKNNKLVTQSTSAPDDGTIHLIIVALKREMITVPRNQLRKSQEFQNTARRPTELVMRNPKKWDCSLLKHIVSWKAFLLIRKWTHKRSSHLSRIAFSLPLREFSFGLGSLLYWPRTSSNPRNFSEMSRHTVYPQMHLRFPNCWTVLGRNIFKCFFYSNAMCISSRGERVRLWYFIPRFFSILIKTVRSNQDHRGHSEGITYLYSW